MHRTHAIGQSVRPHPGWVRATAGVVIGALLLAIGIALAHAHPGAVARDPAAGCHAHAHPDGPDSPHDHVRSDADCSACAFLAQFLSGTAPWLARFDPAPAPILEAAANGLAIAPGGPDRSLHPVRGPPLRA